MNILYATDGSEGALAGARLLAVLPLDAVSQLTILAVVSPHEPADGQVALAAAQEALGPGKANISTLVRHGHPAEGILQVAEEHQADLIVVGSLGCSGIARFLLGSVAERVVRHARCPVLLARPLRDGLRQVIAGVDGSPDSTHAVEWLRSFPLPADSQVRLVAVLPFLEDLIRARMLLPQPLGGYQEAHAAAERQRQQMQEQLDRLAADFTTTGRKAVAEIRQGDPASSLLEAAEEQRADLLVVGSQGLGAVERFIMGSTSEKVLRHAHCSVLVVRRTEGG